MSSLRRREDVLPGVNFLNMELSEKFIEIALSFFSVGRCPTFLHQFEAKKFDNTAKIVYEKSTPGENRTKVFQSCRQVCKQQKPHLIFWKNTLAYFQVGKLMQSSARAAIRKGGDRIIGVISRLCGLDRGYRDPRRDHRDIRPLFNLIFNFWISVVLHPGDIPLFVTTGV